MIKLQENNISLDALRSGDKQEFSLLVETYSARIYRLGVNMLGVPQDAEEVLQNTFLKALEHIRDFEGRSSLSTWLYRIATNEALMLIRKKKQTFNMDDAPQGQESDEIEPANLSDWCCLPEQEFLTREGQKILDTSVLTLTEKLRIVFILRDIEGLSIEVTAKVLNISETAVKTRLLRARLYLREALTDYYGERVAQRRPER